MSDAPRALELLALVESERSPAWSVSFVHTGAPKSKARPRVMLRNGKPHAFTPPETHAAQEALAWQWKLALRGRTYDGCLAVGMIFYRPNRQRIDADNMTKLVLDAGTSARAWLDDSQIVTTVARIELDPVNPRTEVALMPSVSTLDRTATTEHVCEECQDRFVRSVSYRSGTRWCSRKCAYAAQREIAICGQCQGQFIRKRAGQSVCSHACRNAALGNLYGERVAAGKALGPPLCQKCGARVSRREYTQCAKCLGRGRPKTEQSS